MNFPNRRFSSPSIREYQTSKGDSGPRKKRPVPKPILHEPKVFPQSTSCQNQNHCKDHGLIVSAHHENVLNPRISKQKQIFTWLKNVLLKPFHKLFSLSCILKEIWFRKRREPKLLRPKNQFDFIDDENFSKLALAHSFPNSFTIWPDFEIDKPIFGNHFTFLMFAHVLDDYPKSLDLVFDVLRKEKPFDYFFRRFDVVSLVVLKVQDIKDQFQMEASRGGRHHTCVKISGLQRKSSKEKSPRQTISQFPFKYSLNNFDEFVSVQEGLDIRCNDHIKTTRDVADPKRRLLQFDVQEICDSFEKGMMKALKDIRKSHKKSTSTRAPVAEPSLFISEKPKGKSETHVEEFKDFSDSLPIFDESDEEPIENLFSCEKNCDFSSLESEFMNDNEQTIEELTVLQPEHPSSLVLSQQVFEEEPLDYPHQGPRLDTRNPLYEDLGPIFDEEDEPGPVFDEEATSITSIVMESHLCFDPGTTPAPLTPDIQEHLFVLIIQERQVQPLRNESIDRA
ncbi:hypothetical protein F2Q68_00044123 [Brassica cretica]|uniref:Uncharacterized protein n=1 Tax=Brassica cretica TaxID=69181 RepID=A0A8S9LD96_BRACR|nr:hypothetical protein F2Q68_00044123 [Brassica cretica]